MALAELGLPILSDEIYHGLEYGERATSILEVTERAFVLDGFSKRFAMTGWRLGWLIVPRDCARTFQKLQQNLFICANAFVQAAGVVALRDCAADVERMRIGSFVVASMASVNVPAGTVISTERSFPSERALASVAFGSSAARTSTTGW